MQPIGGQAVIEGIMMRNKENLAIAVRLTNGKIKIKKEKSSRLPKFCQYFFIRGIVGLGYTLYDGIKALIWSADQNLGKEEKLGKKEIIGTLLISFAAAIIFFIGLPFGLAKLTPYEGFWFNLVDGIIRVVIFITYLALMNLTKEGRRLFQYHGAEHKSIACLEAKKKLTAENVKKYSRFHPRCGTSFIFIVLILSIIIFSLVEGPWWLKLLSRILLLPVIAGLSYEILKFSAKHHHNWLLKIGIAPGLWLQRLTTKEPDRKQIEVGIAALKNVLR